jgi:hypothetical protein
MLFALGTHAAASTSVRAATTPRQRHRAGVNGARPRIACCAERRRLRPERLQLALGDAIVGLARQGPLERVPRRLLVTQLN